MSANFCLARAYSWWRHKMETFSALLALCAGDSPVPGEFPTQRPVKRSFDVYFDLRPNKRLSKQWRGWWFETQSCSQDTCCECFSSEWFRDDCCPEHVLLPTLVSLQQKIHRFPPVDRKVSEGILYNIQCFGMQGKCVLDAAGTVLVSLLIISQSFTFTCGWSSNLTFYPRGMFRSCFESMDDRQEPLQSLNVLLWSFGDRVVGT